MMSDQRDTRDRSNVARVWRYAIVAYAAIVAHTVHSADEHDTLKMQVGVVNTSDLCPGGYSESCAVERSEGEQKTLLARLPNRYHFKEYRLVPSETVTELALSARLARALDLAIPLGSRSSPTQSAVFIFHLGGAYQSIRLVRTRLEREPDEAHGSVASMGRWYQHYEAGAIVPSNYVTWSVTADEFKAAFRFVTSTQTMERGGDSEDN